MVCISAAAINEAGLVFNVIGAALLAWCAPAGLAWRRDGGAGMRPEPPAHIVGEKERNDAALAIGKMNYKKAKFGMPIGWILFFIGSSLQLTALHVS